MIKAVLVAYMYQYIHKKKHHMQALAIGCHYARLGKFITCTVSLCVWLVLFDPSFVLNFITQNNDINLWYWLRTIKNVYPSTAYLVSNLHRPLWNLCNGLLRSIGKSSLKRGKTILLHVLIVISFSNTITQCKNTGQHYMCHAFCVAISLKKKPCLTSLPLCQAIQLCISQKSLLNDFRKWLQV